MSTDSIIEHNGDLRPRQYKIALVAASFNHSITSKLVAGAVTTLKKMGITASDIEIFWVPGALEIPLTCKLIFEKKLVDGIIAIGAVIRGETAHFDIVAHQSAAAISQVSLSAGKLIANAILTTNNIEEAQNRAGLKLGNKGSEAAMTVLEWLEMTHQSGLA